MVNEMFQELEKRFEPVLTTFLASPAMKHLSDGKLTREEYRSYLKQVYFYVRENPQLQALATVYFRGRQRDLVKGFYQHATSEIGHEQLALNDFVTLGGDDKDTPYENPLPATTALTAFAFYQIYNLNPLGYLGYLYFLEFVPTRAGGLIAEQLANIGIPEGATTFLRDHMEIDVGHNRLMERYADALIRSDADLDCVEYAMKTTGYLYAEMIGAAIRDASVQEHTGWNWEELNADRAEPKKATAKVA